MRAEGLAQRTITHRTGTLAAFAKRGLDPCETDAERIASFLASQHVGKATRANHYRVLRAWHLWLIRTDRHDGNNPMDKIKAPRAPRCLPRPCTTKELGRALTYCNRHRTRVMLLLASYQGMRVHEIAKVRGEDVRGGRIRIIGKGEREDRPRLHPLVLAEVPGMPRSGWWFPSYTLPGQPLRSQSVSETVGNALRRAGVDATAHQLRHWFGTNVLVSSGGNVRTTQRALRHADIGTTQIYTLVEDDAVAAAIEGLPNAA